MVDVNLHLRVSTVKMCLIQRILSFFVAEKQIFGNFGLHFAPMFGNLLTDKNITLLLTVSSSFTKFL